MAGTDKSRLFGRYDQVGDFIKKICGSKIKVKILLSLTREPMRLSEISELIACKRPNTASELKELQGMTLVNKNNKEEGYALTVSGEIMKQKLINLINFLEYSKSHDWVLNQFMDVPEPFIYELGSLINSQKIKNERIDLLNDQNLLTCSGDLKLMTPVFNTNLLRSLFERTSKGAKTEIIVTPSIVKHISKLKSSKEHSKYVMSLMSSSNFKIRKTENNLEVGLGVNGRWMSLGLYKLGNTYDPSSQFTSCEDNAIKFANELFKHYNEVSDKVKKDEL